MKRLGIYVHIPFCKRKCLYCDFLSAPANNEVQGKYVKELCTSIKNEAGLYEDFQVETVFMGGGTPSILHPTQTEQIMQSIWKNYTIAENPEVTIEVNPGAVSMDKLHAYKHMGINRLSIGLQSCNEEELKSLGRIHTFEAFLETYKSARTVGFDNINVDLMEAIPGQTMISLQDTLEKVTGLVPEHISAYSLIVEEGTPFYTMQLALPEEEEERLMYEKAGVYLQEKGYEPYEISNYAKKGYECKHNVGYWRRSHYVGFGYGAASMVNNVRWKNSEASFEKEEIQALSQEEQMEEFMFLGLRMREGISTREFRRQFGKSFTQVYGKAAYKLEQEHLLLTRQKSEEEWVMLTQKGIDVSNYVLAKFLF